MRKIYGQKGNWWMKNSNDATLFTIRGSPFIPECQTVLYYI